MGQGTAIPGRHAFAARLLSDERGAVFLLAAIAFTTLVLFAPLPSM
jgi:hypothetical protein